LFSRSGALRFETVHQAVNGNVIIAEQIHNIALPSGKLTPIMNMAVYEIVDGKIVAWRDYTNTSHAKKLLGI
jgi:limonene-1,2-epoxide hydrolase